MQAVENKETEQKKPMRVSSVGDLLESMVNGKGRSVKEHAKIYL
jgi:hypothetical protein